MEQMQNISAVQAHMKSFIKIDYILSYKSSLNISKDWNIEFIFWL